MSGREVLDLCLQDVSSLFCVDAGVAATRKKHIKMWQSNKMEQCVGWFRAIIFVVPACCWRFESWFAVLSFSPQQWSKQKLM
jgi:hypothetical protein